MSVAVMGAAALIGCDANQKLDLQSLLAFPAPGQAANAPTATAKPPPSPPAAVPAPSPQLGRLHHMKPPEVEALVGSPDFRRVEPPGELWQYRTADCVVDLFFYGQRDDRRVVHEDARPRDPSASGDKRCGDGLDVLKDRFRG